MAENKTLLQVVGIGLLGTIVLIATNGLTFSGITFFDESIINEFGWSKSDIKFRDLINLVTASIIMPFLGAIIDKYGVKRLMVVGLIAVSGLYYMYSFIQTTWHMYAIHFSFAFAVSLAGTLATIIMVSQRVKERRGTAIGIALAGTSAGGIVLPYLTVPLIEKFGWRAAFQYEAIIPIIIMILIVIFLKNVKYEKPAAADTNNPAIDEETGLVELSLNEALKTPVFWAICFAGICCFYSIMGIITNLFLYLRELDFSLDSTKRMFTIFFLIILSAKLFSGVITEYINEHRLFKIQVAIMAFGAVGMAMNTTSMVWPALIAVGLGWGGLYTLLNYIIITTFGVKSAGKIGGIISTFEGVGSGVGAWLTAYISDQTGSYSASLWVIVVLLSIAFLISFFIKPVADKKEPILAN